MQKGCLVFFRVNGFLVLWKKIGKSDFWKVVLMKGEKAEYTINLTKAFMFPVTKRVRKALNEIKAFVRKHTRSKEISISNEVNEYIHKNSKNIPRYLKAVLLKDGPRIAVFLQGGKQLEAYQKKKIEEKKKKEEKKSKAEKKEEKKEE